MKTDPSFGRECVCFCTHGTQNDRKSTEATQCYVAASRRQSCI